MVDLTPEQRAEVIGDRFWGINIRQREVIAAAIRDAENAAFERAVAKAREMGAFGVAQQIAALKHPQADAVKK